MVLIKQIVFKDPNYYLNLDFELHLVKKLEGMFLTLSNLPGTGNVVTDSHFFLL